MCAQETHQFCNAFVLVMICDGTDEDIFLDGNGGRLTSINDIIDDITGISTLNKKPKLVLIEEIAGINFSFYF